uniref:Uncharacterized protein n=1 Tax=Tanacetum cinerariifolium TaxID=118510 RepID=A0A6L2MR28_TANCI|nr:hypothetical protein [Tanacetum cinerariifolium]
MCLQLGEGLAITTNPQHTPTIIQPSSSQPKKTQKPRKPTRKDTQVPQPSGPTESVADEAIHKELGDRLVRATTTTSSLEAEQESEETKTTQKKEIASQQDEIASLKKRVVKLEKRNKSRTHKLKRLYKVGLSARVESSRDEESLVEDDANNEMFDVDVFGGEEMFVAGHNKNVVEEVVDAAQVSTAATTVTITTKEITLAQIVAMPGVGKMEDANGQGYDKKPWWPKEVGKVLGRLLGDVVVRS